MKTIKKPLVEEISVVVNIGLDTVLVDRRLLSYGIIFGTAAQVASNYGIKVAVNPTGKGLILTAPKNRMQLLAERLHFAKIAYFEL